MNQTMSKNFDLNLDKSSNLQSDHEFKNLHQFDIQNVNQTFQQIFQQPQHQASTEQSNLEMDHQTNKFKIETNGNNNLNTNQKTVISPQNELHTHNIHFKKQKLANMKNEDYLSSSSSSSTYNHQQQQSQLNELNQQQINSNEYPHNDGQSIFSRLNHQFNNHQSNIQMNSNHLNKPQTNYSESLSSESSSNQCSPESGDQMDNQYPMNLIKNNQDTSSSSSNDTKEDNQINSKDLFKDANKMNCSNSNSSTSNSSIYSALILSKNQNLNPSIQSTNSDSSSSCNLDNIELVFTKQPAKYHRARYMTEGSRGPIRDKSGKSFPTIKLKGYNNRPVKAYCYLIDDKEVNQPHLFYQASKLTSRCLTNCVEIKFGNTIALEFELHPRNNMELMIDCLGIVKQRLFEIQQQQHSQSEKSHFKTPYCRLAFECYMVEYNHIVKTWSDTIHCKQMMRAPEIHRMSFKECHINDDKELFIIGKNFTKDIKIYFSYGNQWQQQVTPVNELFHQAHIVCNLPKIDSEVMNTLAKTCTDKNGQTTKRLNVELYAICDNKKSGREQFTFYC